MKYSIDYQQLHMGHQRPSDDGDVVHVPAMEGHVSVKGLVKTRLFNYTRVADELFCGINIVVEERDDIDWGALIKE